MAGAGNAVVEPWVVHTAKQQSLWGGPSAPPPGLPNFKLKVGGRGPGIPGGPQNRAAQFGITLRPQTVGNPKLSRTTSEDLRGPWQRAMMHWEADDASGWDAPSRGLQSRFMTSSNSMHNLAQLQGFNPGSTVDRTNFEKSVPREKSTHEMRSAGGPSGPFTNKTKGLLLESHDSVENLLLGVKGSPSPPKREMGSPKRSVPLRSASAATLARSPMRSSAAAPEAPWEKLVREQELRDREYDLEM